jgi:hypothetical protein
MSKATAVVKGVVGRFWAAVDSESVWLFQGLIGTAFILCGLVGIFVAHGALPLTLMGSMGGFDALVWYTLLVVSPSISLFGKAVSTTEIAYGGMWCQLTGDATMVPALSAYLYGTLLVEPIGHGGFGAYIAAALLISSFLFVVRDVRRIMQVRRRVKRREANGE